MVQPKCPTVVLPSMPGLWWTLLRVLMTVGRRVRPVSELPASHWVLPALSIDTQALSRYRQICSSVDSPGRIPVLYPQILGFPLLLNDLASRDYPWSALGVVHLGNDIVSTQSIDVGRPIDASLSRGPLIRHPRGQAFALTLSFSQQGREVWRVTQTLLRLGIEPSFGSNWDEADALGECSIRAGGAAPRAFECVGDFEAPRDIGRRYAPVAGDFNPIHLSRWSARLMGFERPIAHGMWTLARALSLLGSDELEAPQRLRTVFASPVRLPARVSVWAVRSDGECHFEVRDQAGERVHLRSILSVPETSESNLPAEGLQ